MRSGSDRAHERTWRNAVAGDPLIVQLSGFSSDEAYVQPVHNHTLVMLSPWLGFHRRDRGADGDRRLCRRDRSGRRTLLHSVSASARLGRRQRSCAFRLLPRIIQSVSTFMKNALERVGLARGRSRRTAEATWVLIRNERGRYFGSVSEVRCHFFSSSAMLPSFIMSSTAVFTATCSTGSFLRRPTPMGTL
jgi:hypothetical protein